MCVVTLAAALPACSAVEIWRYRRERMPLSPEGVVIRDAMSERRRQAEGLKEGLESRNLMARTPPGN